MQRANICIQTEGANSLRMILIYGEIQDFDNLSGLRTTLPGDETCRKSDEEKQVVRILNHTTRLFTQGQVCIGLCLKKSRNIGMNFDSLISFS